ncbi:hypothetical protein ACE6H2_023419 [Prunus campanulata]
MDLIFSVYVPKFQAEKLVGLFNFFKQCLSSSSETVLLNTLSKLEVSILRYYVVSAIQSGRRDKKPNSDPEFRTYFSKEWYEGLRLSVRNFFSEIFNDTRETCPPATFQIGEAEVNQDWIVVGPAGIRPEINISKSDPNLSSQSSLRAGDGGTADTIQLFQDGPYNENGRESHVEDFPEVKVDFQETFLGHTSPITRCRFSAFGNNIASASEDGTLLISTADGGIKAWNVDAKRVCLRS